MVCPDNKNFLRHVFTLQGNYSVGNIRRVGMNCIFSPIHIWLVLPHILENRRNHRKSKKAMSVPLLDEEEESEESDA